MQKQPEVVGGEELQLLAQSCRALLPLQTASLSDEYYYQSLPLCIIDSVFSIGVFYGGVRAVVQRYCEFFHVRRIRNPKIGNPPALIEQESVTVLCQRFESIGIDRMTEEVFRNRQRTSAKSGIRKSEAVLLFAQVLKKHGIEYLQDLERALLNPALEEDIRKLPGQKSGISLKYFFMLAGSDAFIKPDRMIIRFLESALGRKVLADEAPALLAAVVGHLQGMEPRLTPRLLDYVIWSYQRGQPSGDAPLRMGTSAKKGIGTPRSES